MLDETLDILADHPLAGWESDEPWKVVGAWRGATPWDDDRVLVLDYAGPRPHCLVAEISEVGATMVARVGLTQPGFAQTFNDVPSEPGDVPMPVTPAPIDEVLADLARSLQRTDMCWPRSHDPEFIDHRALAWSRVNDCVPAPEDWLDITDEDRNELIASFLATQPQAGTVLESLADLFIDYGSGYLPDSLAWSPGWVGMFLTDYLPRKVSLDPEQRRELPSALRAWVAFALERRGTESVWIAPVIDAVDKFMPDFLDTVDDAEAWGPAKHIVAQLLEGGVDLTDKAAVDQAIRALNAETAARRLLAHRR